ncbi:MAG TPA: rhomboid family intramembrane serine protease, partial [Verrucomicrobiae bacterium]
MANCPTCKIGLQTVRQREGVYYYCSECKGRAVTVPQIRRMTGDRFAGGLVRKMNTAADVSWRTCPFCQVPMKTFEVSDPPFTLDACKPCVTFWFDAGKFDELPEGVFESPEALLMTALEAEARQKMERQAMMGEGYTADPPDEFWKWIPALLGFPVKYYDAEMSRRPWTTWLLSALIFVVSVWAFTDLEYAIKNFGMIPAEAFRYGGATLLTSFFLHGGVMHLLGNLYFFLLFAGEVENFLGWWRFLLLIFLATIVGHIFHILGNLHSEVPCIGASGGISGVLIFYACQFPRARLGFFFWFLRQAGWIQVPAWAAFVLWFLLQLIV